MCVVRQFYVTEPGMMERMLSTNSKYDSLEYLHVSKKLHTSKYIKHDSMIDCSCQLTLVSFVAGRLCSHSGLACGPTYRYSLSLESDIAAATHVFGTCETTIAAVLMGSHR